MDTRVLDRFNDSPRRSSPQASSKTSPSSSSREKLTPAQIRAKVEQNSKAAKVEIQESTVKKAEARDKQKDNIEAQSKEDTKEVVKSSLPEMKKVDESERKEGEGVKAINQDGEEVVIDEVKSDIGKNDPNSEETQEKLRYVLRTNAFNFSDQERAALSDILMDDKKD